MTDGLTGKQTAKKLIKQIFCIFQSIVKFVYPLKNKYDKPTQCRIQYSVGIQNTPSDLIRH